MSKMKCIAYFRLAAALLFSSVGFAQVDIQIRFGQQPGWGSASARDYQYSGAGFRTDDRSRLK
jgi:hypothetical protein